MSDTATLEQPITETTTTPVIPFSSEWSTTPSPAQTKAVDDPVIKEKDEKIKEEKPVSDKPNEPEKIPAATPEPVQDRPEVKDEKPKEATLDKTEPIKFANEESERISNLLQQGKIDEVREILNEQKKLAEVDKLSPADIIKLNYQYQNKDFSEKEINDLFEDNYSMPEKPLQGSLEDDDEFKTRMEAYDKKVERVQNRIARDSKPAAQQLNKLKTDIVLPDFSQSQAVEKGLSQEELDAQQKLHEQYMKSVDDGLKSFAGYETTFKDEEVELKVSYKPTADETKALMPLLESASQNLGDFLQKLGWIKDGQADTSKMIQDLHLIQNKESIFSTIASETGTQRFAAAKKSIKNIDYNSGQRSNGDLGATPAELQQRMSNTFFGS